MLKCSAITNPINNCLNESYYFILIRAKVISKVQFYEKIEMQYFKNDDIKHLRFQHVRMRVFA